MLRTFALALSAIGLPATAHAQALSDAQAYAATIPQEQIVDAGIPASRLTEFLKPVKAFYAFWANGNLTLLNQAIGANFVDHTLPAGRPQGPGGPANASQTFLKAVPDLKVTVVQRLVVGDRVVSHLRFEGHFTGRFMGRNGTGQLVDFIATDIVKVKDGKITDNWHLEDNLTFLQQIGAVQQ